MNHLDVIRQSIEKGFTNTDYSTLEILVPLGIAFFISLYVFGVYRIVTRNVFFSKEFGIAMVAMSIVTTGIILAMSSSLVISLGMVGALSIVRFRTAVKEPLDLFFLFWSIGIGIICGAGLYKIALLVTACVTVVLIVLHYLPSGLSTEMLFVTCCKKCSEEAILLTINCVSKMCRVLSRTIRDDKTEYVIEIKSKRSGELVAEIGKIDGVINASVVSHNGGN